MQEYRNKVDLIVGGSPCQDFSIAGKLQGSTFECLDCGNEFNPLTIHYIKRDYCPKCNSTNLEKTRSSLLIEYLRTVREIKPKYFIYENVKNIIGKKFKDAFDLFNAELQEYGFNTYYQVLNAKEYGIPQNRERVFVIGIRKDIDKGNFEFPKPFDSGLRLKDFLENEVEEKYYINNERVDELLSKLKDGKVGHYPNVDTEPLSSSALSSREHRASGWSDGIGTLCARDYKDPKVIAEPIPNEIVQINDPNHFSQRVYSKEGISPTISAGNNGGGKEPCKIICEQRTDEGLRFFKDNVCGTIRTIDAGGDKRIIEKTNDLQFVGGIGEKDWVGDGKDLSRNYPQGNRVYDVNGVACSQTAQGGGIGGATGLYLEEKAPNELQLFTNLSGGKWDKIHESSRRVYEENGISPTIPTCGGGNIEPKVAVREATKKGYAIATVGDSINIAFPNSTTRRGRVGEGVAQTLETGCNQATLESDYRIRKLTPRECWRLMGFSDEDFDKARQSLIDTHYNGNDRANSQLYKQAGNSIVVDTLVNIYKNLFKEYI